jgi:hypothetical protein
LKEEKKEAKMPEGFFSQGRHTLLAVPHRDFQAVSN